MGELWRNFELSSIFLCTQLCLGLYFITYRPNLVLYSICCLKSEWQILIWKQNMQKGNFELPTGIYRLSFTATSC